MAQQGAISWFPFPCRRPPAPPRPGPNLGTLLTASRSRLQYKRYYTYLGSSPSVKQARAGQAESFPAGSRKRCRDQKSRPTGNNMPDQLFRASRHLDMRRPMAAAHSTLVLQHLMYVRGRHLDSRPADARAPASKQIFGHASGKQAAGRGLRAASLELGGQPRPSRPTTYCSSAGQIPDWRPQLVMSFLMSAAKEATTPMFPEAFFFFFLVAGPPQPTDQFPCAKTDISRDELLCWARSGRAECPSK